jgi:catechol 2,3-dioxygenase-like lactoylglutathione lyase family enzyme
MGGPYRRENFTDDSWRAAASYEQTANEEASMGSKVNKVATVIIPTSDQDKALDFYVGKLGFEKTVDVPFGGAYRWIEVGLPGESTTIALAPPLEGDTSGGRETGISLQTDDIDGYHARLRDAGVDVGELQRMGDPVPPMFWFNDPEGNTLMVVQ